MEKGYSEETIACLEKYLAMLLNCRNIPISFSGDLMWLELKKMERLSVLAPCAEVEQRQHQKNNEEMQNVSVKNEDFN